MHIEPQKNKYTYNVRGIALIAVLSVLVILAILAVAFSMHMSVESKIGNIQVAKLQSDMIANSALEHVKALIREDSMKMSAWDDYSESMFSFFAPDPSNPGDHVDLDTLPGKAANSSPADSRWIYVKNKDGAVIGRYAVLIEDEASKININVARALNPKMQNEGVGTFETMLTDGKSAGLPVSLSFAKNILRYRYGRDLTPGQSEVDDNQNASSYASDLIDNDADGLVDEEDEGIDEPEEYNSINPKWDDRNFSTVSEVITRSQKHVNLDQSATRTLKRYGTVFSKSKNMFWDESDNTYAKQINLNVASKRQLSTILRKANEETRFESKSKNMRMLVGNITDYHDENNVLTTMGSEYGVEAVCFNEVMANDGSFTLRGDRNYEGYENDNRVYRYGWFYERPSKSQQSRFAWKITSVSGKINTIRDVITNGVPVSFRQAAWVGISDRPVKELKGFNTFKSIMDRDGGWQEDMWKNAWLMVSAGDVGVRTVYVPYPILGNTRDRLLVGFNDNDEETFATYDFLNAQTTTNGENRVLINNLWRDNNGGLTCVFPGMTERFVFPVFSDSKIKNPPRNLYYRVYIGENNLPDNVMDDRNNQSYVINYWEKRLSGGVTPWKGFNPMLDLDGDPKEYSETKMMQLTTADLKGSTLQLPDEQSKVWLLRTPYNNGEPVRANRGLIHVTVTTCKETGYVGGMGKTSTLQAYKNKNVAVSGYMMRPDIVELINISDHPVSLRNWRIVVNTGSYADQVGRIDEATLYSKWRHGLYDDPNPTIQPGGYFYITNNRQIFDRDYGAPKDSTWGSSASESYPCVDVPDTLWGVRYKVQSIKTGNDGDRIVCEGANWKKDTMEYEMSEWYLRKSRADQNSSMGVRLTISGNTKNALFMENIRVVSLKAGDDILILGMPREGGFLSMTLKNQYDQITARTTAYGSTKINEINYSTEKLDPTHYTWIKSRRPTFGGTERKARNHSMPRGNIIKPHVKDNRFATVGEIQDVRKADDWENIGMEKKGHPNTKVLKAIAKYFTTSGIRLDPEEEGVHISGWQPAFGKAKFSATEKLTAAGVDWEPGIWEHQILRINSGDQKGEEYVIKSSSENGIDTVGYSIPSGKQLRVGEDDIFSVGPGYSTPLFYTRKNGDVGIWEWKNKGLSKSKYGLYLSGLNDSIDTTEFLEENHNAQLEIAVFNFVTHQYDLLPISDDKVKKFSSDAYRIVTSGNRHQYEKSDIIYCGIIHPRHISTEGGVRLKITAYGLGDSGNSGFAWFDYAFLAPGEELGRININTACERVLRALNNVSPDLARNIYEGNSSDDNGSLKPYKNITDILDVKDMTPEIFSKNVNLITTRSDQFRVQIIAQAIKNVSSDGIINIHDGDEITAETKIEAIIDRSELTDDDPNTTRFK